jgi:hypothetical protein
MEIIKDTSGNDVVFITNEDGSTLSMLKSEYDRQQAEQSTLGLVNSDNPAEPVV